MARLNGQLTFAIPMVLGLGMAAVAQELVIIAPDGTTQSRVLAGTNTLSTGGEGATSLQTSATDTTSAPLATVAGSNSPLTAQADTQGQLQAQADENAGLVAIADPNADIGATARVGDDMVAQADPDSLVAIAPAPPPPPTPEPAPEPVPIPLPTGTTIRFEDVLFEFDSAALKPAAMPLLAEFAEAILMQPNVTVRLEGHTDSRGSESYNLTLSERRAKAVHDGLVGLGVSPDRLTMIGFGEARPIASNDDETGRSRNRRVDAVVTRH